MTPTVEEISEELNNLILFLLPVESLINSHLVSFFTEDQWNKHVPHNILCELNPSSVATFIKLFSEIIKGNSPNEFAEDHPCLINFINKAICVSIIKNDKYIKFLTDLENLFATSSSDEENVKTNTFMTAKKLHEVKLASKTVALVSNLTKSSHVVDIGDGKGYLSCSLVLDYSLKVLGLDSSKMKTCGAIRRSENVAKFWTGENCLVNRDEFCDKKARVEFIQRYYKQATTFVTPHTDVEALLKEGFNEGVNGITLSGLHTCGDLAPTCLKLFLNCEKIKGVVNFGCCYNHISEEFEEEDAVQYGFPLSRFLRDKKYKLGRNARMLACHSVDRLHSDLDFESSQTSLFYRAVLETIIKKINPPLIKGKVGRFTKNCNNFHDYMYMALKKLQINQQLNDNDLDKLYEHYGDKKPFLTAFYLLKLCLAPVIESIILLDRILYLIENGVSNAYLVPIFDLKISPRGFGIIAWKDYTRTNC